MPFPDLLCLELGRLATMHPTPLRHGFYSQKPSASARVTGQPRSQIAETEPP